MHACHAVTHTLQPAFMATCTLPAGDSRVHPAIADVQNTITHTEYVLVGTMEKESISHA
jgi:hypothetical protein